MREISLANNRFDLIKINSLYIELMLLIKIEKKNCSKLLYSNISIDFWLNVRVNFVFKDIYLL